jgi:hypothetical protein
MDLSEILLWITCGSVVGTWVSVIFILHDLKCVRKEIRDIDRRLSHIEGYSSGKYIAR